ncbi:MAG: hypothetical protein K2P10_07610 [Oscillospiraceae bacterium]|nr:hypothetical protein [Oscillospiraceae bacterium]
MWYTLHRNIFNEVMDMVGAVSGMNAYYNVYGAYGPHSAAQARGAQDAEGAKQAQGTPALWAARRSASPETPVQPVAPVRAADGEESQPVRLGPTLREGADPAEMAVRMRITPYKENAPEEVQQKSRDGNDLKVGAEGAQAAVEEGKCQTCEERKYQDESDDMGVSFQTATNIAPEQAASAVRGHENEHVVREQAKAQREDRRVVSQSVTLHSDICPECGKVYISGGTTRTVTAAEKEPQPDPAQEAEQQAVQKGFSVFG